VSDGVKPTVQESIADPSGYGDPSIGAEFARKLAESQVGSVALGVDDGARYVVGAVDDIPPGSRKVILVNGREIGVFNVNGEFFAVLNRCPHQGGPLCSGRQTGFLVAPTPGDYQLSRPGEVIRCPWHGWEFDLRSGQSWCEPSKVRVRSYDVSVESGETLVAAVPGDPAESATEPSPEDQHEAMVPPGLVKGPYKAETFPVEIQHQYVVVDVSGRKQAANRK
jgi:nitrite reductase/ring-hydroxylating ferredoxin subunit